MDKNRGGQNRPAKGGHFERLFHLGGTCFEFTDEYWKVLPSDVQNTGGFYTYWNPSAVPDSFSNEEYFGTVAIDSNIRTPKQCFAQISRDFNDTLVADFIACDTVTFVNDMTEIPSVTPHMPVVKIQGLSCHDLYIAPGGSVTIIPGITLTINGNITF